MATGSSPSLSLSPLESFSSTVELVGAACCSVVTLSFQPSRSTEREKDIYLPPLELYVVQKSIQCSKGKEGEKLKTKRRGIA